MLSVLKKIDASIVKACNTFLQFTVIAMVVFVVWQVICRYIIKISVPYAEEFARLSIVWCIFIGGGLAVRKNEHIAVDSLVILFPEWLQKYLRIFSYACILWLSLILIRYGWEFCIKILPDTTTALGYSRVVFFVPAVVSGIIMLVYTLVNTLTLLSEMVRKSK